MERAYKEEMKYAFANGSVVILPQKKVYNKIKVY
jgi:hypothetical protein